MKLDRLLGILTALLQKDCFVCTDEGLLFEIEFTHHDYIVSWLLGFGDNVKVLEPANIADDIKAIAENICARYK